MLWCLCFRMFLVRNLPNVEYLDDLKVTDDLRALANTNDDNRANRFHINFHKAYPSLPNMQTIWKCDTMTRRSVSKHGNSCENLNLMRKSSHHYSWIQFNSSELSRFCHEIHVKHITCQLKCYSEVFVKMNDYCFVLWRNCALPETVLRAAGVGMSFHVLFWRAYCEFLNHMHGYICRGNINANSFNILRSLK